MLVWHRHEVAPALEALVETLPGLDIALRGEGRCVIVCETDDQRALLDHIDALQALHGVVNVSLIYHHVESRAELDEPVRASLSPERS
ncbi:nitrate reductase formation protein NapD [Dyella soli]|uniref:Nitrate reductase formation protein NapD n=1 Tax=Dyella soli TaxID=522319 RepID=A0A4R0YTC4_9GAMM|nr:nitrate reductase formation protein NapD [Dyella soli]